VFGARAETRVHPHVEEERAHLFRSVDCGSTEVEVLDFLHALVRLYKPARILETGTFRGLGTIALARGVADNGVGTVVTLDRDEAAHRLARRAFRVFDGRLLKRVRFVEADTLAWIGECDEAPFELVFLDSAEDIRWMELELLLSRGRLASGAVCVIHDTSPHRSRYSGARIQPVEGLDGLRAQFESLECPFSRGLLCLRMP
jgi:predicted O-methyltransferase YrrM